MHAMDGSDSFHVLSSLVNGRSLTRHAQTGWPTNTTKYVRDSIHPCWANEASSREIVIENFPCPDAQGDVRGSIEYDGQDVQECTTVIPNRFCIEAIPVHHRSDCTPVTLNVATMNPPWFPTLWPATVTAVPSCSSR